MAQQKAVDSRLRDTSRTSSYQRELTKPAYRAQPVLCFPPRDVPIKDVYAYTIPIPPEQTSGQMTKEFQDWIDDHWIHASSLTKHSDPTRNVIDCSIKGTPGNGGRLRVIIGPLEKQYPERWPRKMFNQQRFISYPSFPGKDSRARNAEMATWIKELRVKWEAKDVMGRPLTWVQIVCEKERVMIRWRKRLGMGKRKEGQSYRDVSRKSYDTSDRPMPNLISPATSLKTGASAEAYSCISPSPSPSIPPSQMRLLSPCPSLSTSPCPSSIHSSSSKVPLHPPSIPIGILSPSLTPSPSISPSLLVAHPLPPPPISTSPSPTIPTTNVSPIPSPFSIPSSPNNSLSSAKPFTAQSPAISSKMDQQLAEQLAKKEEQLAQWEKLKEEFHDDHYM
ncbi:hypothetical protein D1P53_000928 [Cryptococcus gattii VGV]|nr:hypothetical protein D1P53_000928 [Cryptococcus gattii VGV]